MVSRAGLRGPVARAELVFDPATAAAVRRDLRRRHRALAFLTASDGAGNVRRMRLRLRG